MNRLIRSLGGWRGLVGVVSAAGVLGLQIGIIVADQLANVWPWADTSAGRALAMALGWATILVWALREPRW